MPKLPELVMSFVWMVAGLIFLLIVLAIFKADFSIGAHGIHFTQNLIHMDK